MPKMKTPPPEFKIHIDSSCLTDPTDTEMSPDRIASNQTIIHHEVEAPAEDKHQADGHGGVDQPRIAEEAQNRLDSMKIDRIEAQIHAAARAVVASIEHDNYQGADSVLSTQTDESYEEDSQLTYGEGTELTYDGTEESYETEDEHHEQEDDHHEQDGEGDSSSHHDGDIDDDVFSHSDHSGRSSLNSCNELHGADEVPAKELTSPVVGEEAAGADPVSRIPSQTSYSREVTPVTPSRVLSRPPFRTPSSVRAMQMSSPTPSIFSSPRSTKRHQPTVSRLGTPSSPYSPSKRTPTRFKAKKEFPLVLLHVTVLPLRWTYSHVISSPDLPSSLQGMKDNWRLLQQKLADTVLERGVLLSHPQESYETLEERLLEALELPVRPRARILKCGHYMGPEAESSDEEDRDQYFEGENRRWCDICRREIRVEDVVDGTHEKRFRIKIYASNGLMGPGSWAAAWREMERVDVELEPFVEGGLALELEHMVASTPHAPQPARHEDDGFVDEHDDAEFENNIRAEEEELTRRMMEEERIREIYGPDTPPTDQRPRPPRARARTLDREESLPDLMLAAFKVAMKDRKNVTIAALSVLVLLLALWPSRTILVDRHAVMSTPGSVNKILQTADPVQMEVTPMVVEAPVKVAEPPRTIDDLPAPVIEVQTKDCRPVAPVQQMAPSADLPPDIGPSDLKKDAISVGA